MAACVKWWLGRVVRGCQGAMKPNLRRSLVATIFSPASSPCVACCFCLGASQRPLGWNAGHRPDVQRVQCSPVHHPPLRGSRPVAWHLLDGNDCTAIDRRRHLDTSGSQMSSLKDSVSVEEFSRGSSFSCFIGQRAAQPNQRGPDHHAGACHGVVGRHRTGQKQSDLVSRLATSL